MIRPHQAWYNAVHLYDCSLHLLSQHLMLLIQISYYGWERDVELRVVKGVIGPGRLVEGGIVVVRVHQFEISRRDKQLIIPYL